MNALSEQDAHIGRVVRETRPEIASRPPRPGEQESLGMAVDLTSAGKVFQHVSAVCAYGIGIQRR